MAIIAKFLKIGGKNALSSFLLEYDLILEPVALVCVVDGWGASLNHHSVMWHSATVDRHCLGHSKPEQSKHPILDHLSSRVLLNDHQLQGWELLFAAFANFHGGNTATSADLKLPM